MLDPGIQRFVVLLRAYGFDTTDSGDGVSKAALIAEGHALATPHVHMVVQNPKYLYGLARELRHVVETQVRADHLYSEYFDASGQLVPVVSIQATYDPMNDSAILSVYGVADEHLI